MASEESRGPVAVVLTMLGMVGIRVALRAAYPRASGWEVMGGALLVVALVGTAIGACVLIWRTLRAVFRRVDRALPDRERDRRGELEAVYMKASLERWVHTGSSGDAALDARFAAIRQPHPPARETSGAAATRSGDDPRTLALIAALEGQPRRERGATRP